MSASRSLGVATLGLLTLLASEARAQRADAIEDIRVTGFSAAEIRGEISTGTDRDMTVNIEGCLELLADTSDTIQVTWTFARPDTDRQYVVKLRRRTEACAGNSLGVAGDECRRLAEPANIAENVTATFQVADLLGTEFDAASDCFDGALDGAYSALLVFEEETTDGTVNVVVDTLNINVELSRPTSPSGVSVRAGESSATVSWSSVSGASGYEVYVTTNVADFEVDQPENLSPSARSATSTSREVSGLTVDTTYYAAVLSVDENGNRSALSEATEFTTVESLDFWEQYRAAGGVEEGGCTSARGPHSALWGLALVGLLLATRRRRGTGALAAAALVGALASIVLPSTALADIEFVRDSRVSGAFELKLGPYRPDIDSDFDGVGPYERMFGERTSLLIEAEYDYQFWRGVGSLGAFGAFGWNQVGARAETVDGTRSADDTRLRILPFRVGLVYRFDYLVERWNIPFAFALKTGFDYYAWFVRNDGGIADHADADGNRTVGRGGTTGYHFSVGGYFLLDFLAPRMAQSFDMNSGVNNTYAFVELTRAQVDDFGGKSSWDLSDTSVLFGLAFEF